MSIKNPASQTSVSPLSHPTPRRLQGGRVGSLEFALIFIALLAAVIGLIEIGVAAGTADGLLVVIEFVALFWIWMAAGIVAWWRRPTNGIGGLLLIGAILVVLSSIGALGAPALYPVYAVFASSPLAVAVHLLLAFPSGRVRGRWSIITVVLGYITCIVFDSLRALTDGTPAFGILSMLQSLLGLSVMIMTAIELVRRLRRADAGHRRILGPLFAYGILAVLALPMIPNILIPLGVELTVTTALQGVLLAGLPLVFLTGVLRGTFTRTTPLEALSQWLAIPGSSRPAVARALATTLGDGTLRVAYWDAVNDRFADEDGRAIQHDPRDADRGWLQVFVDDDLVGAISYDARMIAEPSPVRRAAEVLAIALDRERMTTQLLASNDALQLSRSRIVEAADRERFRIARDLHDGLQMQLVLLAIEAQTIANTPADSVVKGAPEKLRRGIDLAAADLRRLVHDVLPPALLEQGLVIASEDLIDRLPMPSTFQAEVDDGPLPVPVAHTAYFIVAEALANTVKHAQASQVSVTITRHDDRLIVAVTDDGIGGAQIGSGMGLRGLADRVDALRGTISLESEPGRGTRLRVELPCA